MTRFLSFEGKPTGFDRLLIQQHVELGRTIVMPMIITANDPGSDTDFVLLADTVNNSGSRWQLPIKFMNSSEAFRERGFNPTRFINPHVNRVLLDHSDGVKITDDNVSPLGIFELNPHSKRNSRGKAAIPYVVEFDPDQTKGRRPRLQAQASNGSDVRYEWQPLDQAFSTVTNQFREHPDNEVAEVTYAHLLKYWLDFTQEATVSPVA